MHGTKYKTYNEKLLLPLAANLGQLKSIKTAPVTEL